MKAIFRSGNPDKMRREKAVSIETTIGTIDGISIEGITIKPDDAPAIDLWYNPVTKRWSMGYNSTGKRVIVDLPESI